MAWVGNAFGTVTRSSGTGPAAHGLAPWPAYDSKRILNFSPAFARRVSKSGWFRPVMHALVPFTKATDS